ncbi:MAG TPA: DNA polymerase III subunit delta [Candidatus Magasanikbacteria bacterium]|jgi:DNA polymerase-3 subunit delta|nr:MAG: DNA polymerase III subunit delta [Parcubacteria group bacterium ADurb.Bin115]HOD87330.1 DNA polymerase III subunit delta [bacterium]HPV70856.1 DNA polymerase III subunit delta [Candidatus Magasanikbacteria bacterium]HQB76440.1 DNA polymerase III subunit delta [bacterium]HQL34912.1 DNA polymerase III subunit delta [bacterium]
MIFLLHGADSFRRQQKLNELKQRFMSAIDSLGQSLIILDGRQTSDAELQEKISSGSLFTKKRMVIVEDIFSNKNEAIFETAWQLCKKNSGTEDNALIFNENEITVSKLKTGAKKLYNWLLQQPFVQEFKLLNNAQVLNFAQKEIENQGGKISPNALSLLIARTGNDLWRLNNEIQKLTAAGKNKIIDESLIQALVKNEVEDNIFALTDAFGYKNSKLALKLLEEQFIAGLSAEYILAMCQRQFKIILQIKQIQNQNRLSEAQLASQLKLHPFVIKKSNSQANKFSLNELDHYFQTFLELDYKNKQGKTDLKSELYALAASLS